MLDAVAAVCSDRGVACELAHEAPMACGYGACFGCAVPNPDGGYLRLCIDGPVLRAGARTTSTEDVPSAGGDRSRHPEKRVAQAGAPTPATRLLRHRAEASRHQRVRHVRRGGCQAGLRRSGT
jgi:hypothetical protein